MGESHWRRPQARGCGGPRRQEEKEEAASPLAHPPTPAPTSGPRGPANRMEVGAGRIGSERRHWPGLSRANWGRGLCPKTDPLSLGGKPLGKEAVKPAEKAAVNTSS